MSIFRVPKTKPRAPKAPQLSKEKITPRPIASKPSDSTPRLGAIPDRDLSLVVEDDEAIANLKSSYAKVQAEKRENAYVWKHTWFREGAEADLS